MRNCKDCKHRSEECDSADGALVALGLYWGGTEDRDCPKELEEWRKTADLLITKKNRGGRKGTRR